MARSVDVSAPYRRGRGSANQRRLYLEANRHTLARREDVFNQGRTLGVAHCNPNELSHRLLDLGRPPRVLVESGITNATTREALNQVGYRVHGELKVLTLAKHLLGGLPHPSIEFVNSDTLAVALRRAQVLQARAGVTPVPAWTMLDAPTTHTALYRLPHGALAGVGLTQVVPTGSGHCAMIFGMAVKSSERRLGVGTSIINSLLNKSQQLYKYIHTSVVVELDNTNAIKMYLGLGFEERNDMSYLYAEYSDR